MNGTGLSETRTNADVSLLPPTDQKALEWLAVLSAAGFDYELSFDDGRWVIRLSPETATAARTEIDAYEADEAQTAHVPPPRPQVFRFSSDVSTALWVVAFVAACHVLFGPASQGTPPFLTGTADSGRIRDGEWWRAVTALMLHVNGAHLAGNLFGLFSLGYLVCRLMGSGLGWFMILAAGALGNAVEAMATARGHVGVGASTAVFGALGILVGCRVAQLAVARRRLAGTWSGRWFPFGAGLSLLAMWGSYPGSDVVAHLFGFAAGVVLAIPFGIREFGWTRGRVQAFLRWICVAVVVGAWGLAGLSR
jgi:rhomboid protease GluP